jgi:hypothetical protein
MDGGGDVDLELVECGEKLGREDTHFSQNVSYDSCLATGVFLIMGIPQLLQSQFLPPPRHLPFLCATTACVLSLISIYLLLWRSVSSSYVFHDVHRILETPSQESH